MMIDTERGELVKTPNDIEINGKITKKELIQTAVNTKNNKAYGHDEIPYEFYKKCSSKILGYNSKTNEQLLDLWRISTRFKRHNNKSHSKTRQNSTRSKIIQIH